MASHMFESPWPLTRDLNLEYFQTRIRMQGLVKLVFGHRKLLGCPRLKKKKKMLDSQQLKVGKTTIAFSTDVFDLLKVASSSN